MHRPDASPFERLLMACSSLPEMVGRSAALLGALVLITFVFVLLR
jgi:hypothetical protein